MKNYILIILFLFTLGNAFGQNTPLMVNTSQLGNTPLQLTTNLHQAFTVIFKPNAASAKLSALNNTSDTVTLKDGFSAGELAVFGLSVNSNGSDLTTIVNGNTIKLKAPVTLIYNKHIIKISHAEPGADQQTDNTKKPTEGTDIIEIHAAIKAATAFRSGKGGSFYSLLGRLKGATGADSASVTAAWKGNPYIPQLIADFKEAPSGITLQGGFSDIINSVGNTNVTTITDGIAKFLVKRTKEELTVNFFQNFKDLLNKPEYKDAQILFPKTVAVLNQVDQDIYQFNNYIESLRSAFNEDFSLILDHAPGVITDGYYKAYFNSHTDVKNSALLAIFIAKGAINGTHPGKLLETLPQDQVSALTAPYNGVIQTVQLLSSSIRSNDHNRYWTTLDTLKKLADINDPDQITARFYLGFLYEKAANIKYKNDKTNNLQNYLTIIATKKDDVKAYITFVQKMGEVTENIEGTLQQIKKHDAGTPAPEIYTRLFAGVSDLLEQTKGVTDLPQLKDIIKLPPLTNNYLTIFRYTNQLAADVSQKNYNASINDAYQLYLQALLLKKGSDGNLASLDTSDTSIAANSVTANATVKFISKYGSFMANMVKAKSSDDVEAAIEAIALPTGSASIKKHSPVSIALQAYVGPYMGWEKISGVDSKYQFNNFGLTAPIGFSISTGLSPAKQGSASLSLFLSVIDLGAPVAFRFGDSKTEQIPTIQLKDIISPGAFVSLGLPKFPVSVNAGWQMGPNLRNLTDQTANHANAKYGRFSISLVVDIPVLNIYKSN